MSSHMSWDKVKGKRQPPADDERAAIERELVLEEQAYGLRFQGEADDRPPEAHES